MSAGEIIIGHKWSVPIEYRIENSWYKFNSDDTVEYQSAGMTGRITKENFTIKNNTIKIGEKEKHICATSDTHILLSNDSEYEILVRTS
jgi:hypothetical protein